MPALTPGIDSSGMDLQLVAGAIFLAGLIGVVVWMVSRLGDAYTAERAKQAPASRSSPILVTGIAVVLYGGLAWFTDYRAAVTIVLAAVALVTMVQNFTRRA